MVVMVLLGVLQGWLGGAVCQEGEQTSGCRVILLCSGIGESRADISPLFSADLRHKLSTYMIDQSRGAPTVLVR